MEHFQIPKYVMSTLCRICAEKSSKLTPIFESESLSLKIHICLTVHVKESDYLPLKVCESCFYKINESYTLYLKANEADQRLKKLWKVLLKETMAENSEIKSHEEKAVTVINNSQPFVSVEEEVDNKLSPLSLIINIPEKVACQNAESFGGANQLVNRQSNDIMVISKALSLEFVSESLVLTSPVKINEAHAGQGIYRKVLHDIDEKTSDNEESKQIGKQYKCRFCSRQLSSLATLSVHESTHSDERPYLCDTCGKAFKHAKYLRSHSRSHLVVRKKFTCKICNKGFLTNFFLQEHMNLHTGETPYKCQVCDKEFRERVHLRQHKWTHSTQKFICEICGSSFNRKGNMTEHIKQHHKNGASGKSKKTRKKSEDHGDNVTYKCSACSCEFPNRFLLKAHLKIHPEQKRFACAVCGKKFRHSGSLTYHRRTAHTGERPFQCSFCDLKFSLRSVQKIHERKIHTFENPFKCIFCSRQFTNSSSLRNHLYVHMKEKMFKCDECGKKFSRSSNLFVHKKLHSGDRKFTCDQCGKTYIQKHDLLKHRKVHDPKSKPFFCKYCGNSFSRKKDSTKHAMCQFDFLRKNNSDIYSAEKMLDSVTNSLEKVERNFSVEEEQQLILESVEEFPEEKAQVIYRNSAAFEFSGLKDFLLQYNKISESCFLNCVNHLSERTLSQDECGCVDMCTKKFISVNHKVMQVYLEIQPILINKRIEEMNKQQSISEEASNKEIKVDPQTEISGAEKPRLKDINEPKKLVNVKSDSDLPNEKIIRTEY